MAIIEVKVPQLSESVAEATLLQWKKQPGERVEMDEILVEIETDKVVLEVPAPASGVMAQLVKNDGESCVAEEVIAKIDTEAVAKPSAKLPAPAAGAAPAGSAAKSGTAAVMPAAAKLMTDNQLAAGSVAGSGKDGRVTKGDVLTALEGEARPAPAPAQPASAAPATKALPPVAAPLAVSRGDRPEQRVPMSRLRARVAERLLQSQATNAILTTFNEVNMAPVMEMRKRFQEKFEKEHGVKIGFMSFFVKAAVAALKKYPVLNASVDGTDIVYHGYFDIGIAVGSPRGLVVPILRNADQMSFADIEKKIAEYGVKARDGKL
ncbi:MAG: 2-oxo acid dehydrogenase subunit E2, partial [Burkholderiaceae bacterium]